VKVCELNLYADDVEMHCSNVDLSCVESDLQGDLQSVNSWLCVNRLTLSIKKSNVMLIGSCKKPRNNDLRVTVDNKRLSHVSSVGLHLDEHLAWHHILLGTNIQQVFFKGFTVGYTTYITYALFLLPCFLNCTVFLCYPY